MKEMRIILALVATLALIGLAAPAAQATTIITFAPGDYDNTANTVTGSNASPVYNVNQTTGNFRDVFWWTNGVNSSGFASLDYINSGLNLISNGGSPARAVVGGDDYALNFTGVKIANGGESFLSIYDKTPGPTTLYGGVAGALTKNLFDATQPGGLTISADVLFAPGQHAAWGGVVALYSEGQDALALLANNAGGNNTDVPALSLIYQSNGVGNVNGIVLTSVSLVGTSFVGDTNGSIDTGPNSGDHWYRVIMNVSVSGDTWTETGSFWNHLDPTDPNSALGTKITDLNFSGSLSVPSASTADLARVLTNPGEIGVMASVTGSFNDGVDTAHGGTAANPLVDNVGVSITNFTVPDGNVPEPATMLLLGSGLIGIGFWGFRKKFKK